MACNCGKTKTSGRWEVTYPDGRKVAFNSEAAANAHSHNIAGSSVAKVA